MSYHKVLIIDFGSPTTQLLARLVREAGVYSEILPCTAASSRITESAPDAIILSGGLDSLNDADAVPLDSVILAMGIPVLGIGYGAALLTKAYGGSVRPATAPAHAAVGTFIIKETTSPLWGNAAMSSSSWRLIGDVLEVPADCTVLATNSAAKIVAWSHNSLPVYAVQFFPEDARTEDGKQILENFLFNCAELQPGWTMPAFVDRIIAETQAKVGTGNVVLGLSGGIDSTVVAGLLHRALQDRLHCIFVDHGLLRMHEKEEVQATLEKHMPGLTVHYVDARKRFLDLLAGVEDPEKKRQIIGHTFIEVFDEEATKIENVHYLAQGTVYPDIIESYSPKGVTIKSHHNVGGLPETMKLELIEPLRELFKDEVRRVGKELGLPETLIWRHPFPGPGLGVRILGAITEERVALLQRADRIVYEELLNSGSYYKIWQGFAVLLPLKTVGVSRSGSERTYEHVIALRFVDSIDAMSAKWSRVSFDLLEKISSRILAEVDGVNRIVYDISSKPPSTIEWE